MSRHSDVDISYENFLRTSKKTKVIDKCEGCARINERTNFCTTYVNPEKKWRLGNCPLATHVVVRVEENQEKRRVGQQKQKKRK